MAVKISVIIPIHNSERTIEVCLKSIFANTFRDFEVIVVDDAGTDRSLSIAEQFPCKIIRLEENRGPAYARLAGIKKAQGDIIAYTDSDCIAPPDWLEKIYLGITNNTAGIGGKYILPEYINPISRLFITYWDIKNIVLKKPRRSISLYGGNSAFRKEILLQPRKKQELFYCNKKVGGDDTLLCSELSGFGNIIYDPNISVIHNKNVPFINILLETIALGYSGTMVAGVCGRALLKEPQRVYKTFLYLLSVILAGMAISTLFLPSARHIFPPAILLYFFSVLPLAYFTYTSAVKSYMVILIPLVTFISDILHFTGTCRRLRDILFQKCSNIFRWIRFAFNMLNNNSLSRTILFVTKRCNASCGFCFNNDSTDSLDQELSLDEISKITKNIPYLPWLTISGGEPFLRKDLHKICTMFYENCGTSKITIVTNGSLPYAVFHTAEKIMLDAHGVHLSVGVAFDHIKDRHDMIKGLNGCYDKAVLTIKMLNSLKTRFPGRITIGINTILNNDNSDDIMNISEHLTNNFSYDYHVYNPMRTAPRIPPNAGVMENEAYYKLIKNTNNRLKSGLFHQAFVMECCKTTMHTGNAALIPCRAVSKFLVINNDGNVFACELIRKPLGNLKDNDYKIELIRNNKTAEDMKDNIRQTGCYCQWPCAVTSNTFFNIRPQVNIIKRVLCRSFHGF